MAVDPAELPGSVITQQVTNGIAVRMAVLFELLGGGRVNARTRPTIPDQSDRRHEKHPDPRRHCWSIRPASAAADVPIADGVIVEVGAGLAARRRRGSSSTPSGCIVCPGFVDLHVHLREPGREEAETIETGSRAAAKGGFTCIVAMPNTDPTQDSVDVIEYVRRQEAEPACAMSPGAGSPSGGSGPSSHRSPSWLPGVRLFTDDGTGVQDPPSCAVRSSTAGPLGIALAQHCEVARFTAGAVMHEARVARASASRAGRRSPRN